MENFRYALTLANLLHDVEGTTEELEEIGLVAYNFIGNKNTKLYKVVLDVINGIVELPCNANLVESVTYPNFEINSVENYIENQKVFNDPLYISGKFVKYRQSGNILYISEPIDKVLILYHGQILDEDGLPEITEKEAIAIADYIAYVVTYKNAIKTNNSNLMQISQNLKQQWLFHCDAARVPEYLSQNDMDKILDAKTTWNRKQYGKSFKSTL